MQSTSTRLRSIVRAIPGARPLRRAVLDFWARRRAAHDTVPPRGALDRPEVVTIDRRAVTFDGWALVGRRTAATVDVVLNEMTTVHANLGSARPDVPVSLSEPAAVACGWVATIDLAQWPLGDLRIKVIATSRSGRSSVIGHRMYTLIGEGFEGYLDTPPEGAEVHGDLLIVQGWATVGQRPASRIDIHLNGRYAGRARLRVVRSDVERHGAGRLGPVTGFEYRGVLTPNDVGRLEIAITVHALDGTTVAVPPRHVRVVVDDQAIDEARVRTVRDRTEAALAGMPPSPVVAGAIPPSLLVFTHSLALGGGQLYLSELLRQLAPSLAHCIVVAPTDGVLRQGLETDGIEVRILEDPPYGDISQYEDYVRDRARLIRSSGCNVALLNTLGPWAAGDACSRAGLPFVWAIHESFELSDWIALNFGASAASGYIRRQMETALQAAHRLVFEAHATSDMFARVADATHRTVVAYGVDTARIAAFARDFDRAGARREQDIPLEAVVLLAMGVFEERKSQASIVEAFMAVADAHPTALLILVGDHPCSTRIPSTESWPALHVPIASRSCRSPQTYGSGTRSPTSWSQRRISSPFLDRCWSAWPSGSRSCPQMSLVCLR